MDRQAQVNWLEEIAGDLSCSWAGTPTEIVADWEEGGKEQDALPEWYDQHDRELLIRTLGKYIVCNITEFLENELYFEGVGFHTSVTVEEGGKTPDGLDYNPQEIQVVLLDPSGVVAYQYVDDAVSEPWLIGTPDDVGKCWLVYVDDED